MIFHPDKTSIGPLVRGFSFLGYTYEKGRWSIRAATLGKCVESIRKLLELKLEQRPSSDRFKQKTIRDKKLVVEHPLSLKQKRELPYWVSNTARPFSTPAQYVSRFLQWAKAELSPLLLDLPSPNDLIMAAQHCHSILSSSPCA